MALVYITDGAERQLLELRQTEVLVRRNNIYEVVPGLCLLLPAGLGGADVHMAIYLAAIGTDDFAIEYPGKMESQLAFTDTGRADDCHQRLHFRCLIADV